MRKPILRVICFLAAWPVHASETEPFAPVRFQLSVEATTSSGPVIGLRLDVPIGPLRIDYGIPIQSDEFRDRGGSRFWIVDGPGPGYQQQRAKTARNDRGA
jgi:hypothetical protein